LSFIFRFLFTLYLSCFLVSLWLLLLFSYWFLILICIIVSSVSIFVVIYGSKYVICSPQNMMRLIVVSWRIVSIVILSSVIIVISIVSVISEISVMIWSTFKLVGIVATTDIICFIVNFSFKVLWYKVMLLFWFAFASPMLPVEVVSF
jgi:hypothetical protein